MSFLDKNLKTHYDKIKPELNLDRDFIMKR